MFSRRTEGSLRLAYATQTNGRELVAILIHAAVAVSVEDATNRDGSTAPFGTRENVRRLHTQVAFRPASTLRRWTRGCIT